MNMEKEDNSEVNKLEIAEVVSGSISVSQELSQGTKRNLAEAAFAGMRGGRLSDEQVDRFFQIPEDEIGDWEFSIFAIPTERNTPEEVERMLEREGFEPAGLGHLDAFKNQAPEGNAVIATRNILHYKGGINDDRSAFPTYEPSRRYGNPVDLWEMVDIIPGGDHGVLVLGVKKA